MSSPQVPSRHDGVRYLYMLAAFVVIVAGMRAAEQILNPLLLAVFASVICAPVYLGLLRRGMSQWLAILIVTGALAFIVVILTSVVTDSISRFTSPNAQKYYLSKIPERKKEISGLFESWMPDWETIDSSIDSRPDTNLEPGDETNMAPVSESTSATDFDGVRNAASAGSSGATSEGDRTFMDYIYELFSPGSAISLATRLARSLGSLLSNGLLITLTVVFILLEVGSFEEKLKHAFPLRKDTTQQAEQMVRSVQRYMVMKTTLSVMTAGLIGLWLLIGQWVELFDLRFISLWVLLAFLLNFVPNVGSIIAAVPAILITWLESGTQGAMLCAMGYVVVNVAIGNLLEPRIMGRDLGLSPLVIFCSMVFWGWVLGPIGMLLSVPLTMTAHIVLNGFDDTRWIATLMGDRVRDVQ